MAGFGKGSAQVSLTPQGEGCELGYQVHASVGGKIAQVGQRLIDGVAKAMAESFFKRFEEEMRRRHGPAEEEPEKKPGALKKMWSKLKGGGDEAAESAEEA